LTSKGKEKLNHTFVIGTAEQEKTVTVSTEKNKDQSWNLKLELSTDSLEDFDLTKETKKVPNVSREGSSKKKNWERTKGQIVKDSATKYGRPISLNHTFVISTDSQRVDKSKSRQIQSQGQMMTIEGFAKTSQGSLTRGLKSTKDPESFKAQTGASGVAKGKAINKFQTRDKAAKDSVKAVAKAGPSLAKVLMSQMRTLSGTGSAKAVTLASEAGHSGAEMPSHKKPIKAKVPKAEASTDGRLSSENHLKSRHVQHSILTAAHIKAELLDKPCQEPGEPKNSLKQELELVAPASQGVKESKKNEPINQPGARFQPESGDTASQKPEKSRNNLKLKLVKREPVDLSSQQPKKTMEKEWVMERVDPRDPDIDYFIHRVLRPRRPSSKDK